MASRNLSWPVAALDIGSNTVRLLVASTVGDELVTVAEKSKFVRLGLGIDRSGQLDSERTDAALKAIALMVRHARKLGVDTIAAVATSAVRDAANGAEFVCRIRDEVGIDVEIASGEREACLTFIGVGQTVAIDRDALIVDLGGGSAELIGAHARGMQWARSVPVGCGRLTERFVTGDPVRDGELEHLGEYVSRRLEALPDWRPSLMVLTGGTAVRAASICGQSRLPGEVSRGALREAARHIHGLTANQIAATFDVRVERARVLPAGLRVLQATVDAYTPESLVVTRGGIREGVILDALRRQQFPSAA